MNDTAKMLAQAQDALKDVSPQDMLESAKLGVLTQLRANPPPSYFEGMRKRGYNEASARAMWDFCYAQGVNVHVDIGKVIAESA